MNTGPVSTASVMGLEISDFPPPDTGLFFHAHLVAGWPDVGLVRLQFDAALDPVLLPGNPLRVQVKMRVMRDIDDFRKFLVHAVTLRLQAHQSAVICRDRKSTRLNSSHLGIS